MIQHASGSWEFRISTIFVGIPLYMFQRFLYHLFVHIIKRFFIIYETDFLELDCAKSKTDIFLLEHFSPHNITDKQQAMILYRNIFVLSNKMQIQIN